MRTTILIIFFISCSQTINSTREAWDLRSPLIVNKKGNEIFFPQYVAEETKGDSSQESTIIYKEPGDTDTVTYTICKDVSNPATLVTTPLAETVSFSCPKAGLRLTRDVVKDSNGQTIACGSKNSTNSGYVMYSFFTNLSVDETKTKYRLVFYNYCFDKTTTQITMYGYYDLPNPKLLGNELLATQRNYKFTMMEFVRPKPDSTTSEIDYSTSYGKQNDYEAFEVVASAFAPFGHWVRSFHQLQNTAPMNKDLIPVWKLFVKNVRSELSKKSGPIKIYSGVYDILRVNGAPQYLPNNKTPIPEYWWILFYNKNKTQGVSVIMHNYSYAFGEEKVDPLCGESVCGDVGLQGAVPQGEGYNQALIYCCPASTIASRFNFDPEDGLFRITDQNSTALQ